MEEIAYRSLVTADTGDGIAGNYYDYDYRVNMGTRSL